MDSDDSIATQFLAQFAETVNTKDFAGHMDLISEGVQIHGLPGFDAIGYEEWARQCKHELDSGILDQVAYDGLTLRTAPDSDAIIFATVERVRASDGSLNTMGLELTIEQEGGKWRLTRERILSNEELESLHLRLE